MVFLDIGVKKVAYGCRYLEAFSVDSGYSHPEDKIKVFKSWHPEVIVGWLDKTMDGDIQKSRISSGRADL